jgi:hypothetical protein
MIARKVHSLTETKTKQNVMIARKVQSLTKQNVMIARKVHSLTNKNAMIARQVHQLTTQKKCHDCTTSSFIDQKNKRKRS